MKRFLEKRSRLLFFSLVLSFSLEGSSERDVWAHLLINDQRRAYECAKQCVLEQPQSQLAFETYLHCVALCEGEHLWYKEWQRYKESDPERAYHQKILESAAWSILERAKKASSSQVRQLGLIGAGLTRDVRSIPIILQGLKDSNASIRELSVEMVMLYGDSSLKKGLKAAYEVEKIRRVRSAMIRAFGRLRMHEMTPSLLQNMEEGRLSTEEQCAFTETLVHLTDRMSDEELERLVTSKRSALRMLGAEVIAKCAMGDKRKLLLQLLKDPNPNVCVSALKAMGLLRLEEITEIVTPYLQETRAPIAITASWLVKLQGDERGDRVLTYWIKEGDADTRALAAAAICALGPYGVTLAEQLLPQVTDPFVKANLALALIGQRHNVKSACEIFEDLLQNNQERWMMEPHLGGLFTPLKKSNLAHRRGIPHYPELASQVIRLQMLSLLAILEHAGAEEILKNVLKKSHWRVTGLAAELLLEEGGEEALSCVRSLLHDSDPLVVLEAALVLAVWGRDAEAIPYLLSGYEDATIETKVKILESLSRIKDKSTIPFLVTCLDESSHLLRIISASILLQTMNN